MTQRLKLFGHPDSGHAFKVRLMLAVSSMEHEYELVDIHVPLEQRSSEFRHYARFGEVPVLLDDGECLVQSNAILRHLAAKTRQFGGEDAVTLNACTEWLMWEANKIGMCVPQLRVYHRFAQDKRLEAALPWLQARYQHDVGLLEHRLSDGRSWVIDGDMPTIADFSLCGYLYFADEAKLTVPSKVQAWLNRIAELPGWRHPYELLAAD